MSDKEQLGSLFPLGGPTPRDLIVGREGDIDEVATRLREGLHTMLAGPRRIGKTTVCDAACDALRKEMVVIDIDVPERPHSRDLLQTIVNTCTRISVEHQTRRFMRAAAPLAEALLKEAGLPLDLRDLGARPAELPIRTVIGLPAAIAEREHRRIVFFLDEIQRVVDYSDGETLIADLVDIYAQSDGVVVLADGSNERAAAGLFEEPNQFGKLVDKIPLAATIPIPSWRAPLTERFALAGLSLADAEREKLLTWGGGHPYRTMAAARYTAFSARKTKSERVDDFDLQMGIDEAERHLRDDGFA